MPPKKQEEAKMSQDVDPKKTEAKKRVEELIVDINKGIDPVAVDVVVRKWLAKFNNPLFDYGSAIEFLEARAEEARTKKINNVPESATNVSDSPTAESINIIPELVIS